MILVLVLRGFLAAYVWVAATVVCVCVCDSTHTLYLLTVYVDRGCGLPGSPEIHDDHFVFLVLRILTLQVIVSTRLHQMVDLLCAVRLLVVWYQTQVVSVSFQFNSERLDVWTCNLWLWKNDKTFAGGTRVTLGGGKHIEMRGGPLFCRCFLKCTHKICSDGNTAAGALLLFFHGYNLNLISRIAVIDLPIYLLWSPRYVYIITNDLIFKRRDMLNSQNEMEDWLRAYDENHGVDHWNTFFLLLPRFISPGTQRRQCRDDVIVLIWCQCQIIPMFILIASAVQLKNQPALIVVNVVNTNKTKFKIVVWGLNIHVM